MPLWAAGIGAIGSIGGSILGGNAAGDAASEAAKAQEAALLSAMVSQNRAKQNALQMNRPYEQAGYGALPFLEYFTTGVMPEFDQQARLDELSGKYQMAQEKQAKKKNRYGMGTAPLHDIAVLFLSRCSLSYWLSG